MTLHPEKAQTRDEPHYSRLKAIWTSLVSIENNFFERLEDYSKFFSEYLSKYSLVSREELRAHCAFGRVVRDWLVDQIGPSYGQLGLDNRFHQMVRFEMEMFAAYIPGFNLQESFMTDIITSHAVHVLRQQGNKIYEISRGLQWQLENTELRRYPTSGLRLPFPAIYVVLPSGKYKVYNEITGWHDVEGAYIVEDMESIPRTWRVILTGLPNKNSPIKEDDALYHWTVKLPEDVTVEDAVDLSFEQAETQLAGKEVIKIVKKDGELCEVPVSSKHGVSTRGYLDKMRPILVETFRYLMKVVIYATLPDAEQVFRDASKEYERLKSRASKLPKGKKKRRLLDRMKKIDSRPRIFLGGSVVVDRVTREGFEEEGVSSGRKQKVRSLVSGHFHGYWTGKGRTTFTQKFVQPYWRGPEHAPLTTKKRVLKHAGK